MMIPIGMGNLGQTYKQTADGTVVDCDLPENIVYSVCWNPFAPTAPSSAVPSMNPMPAPSGPPAPVATPGNPTPLTTPPASAADAQATINATLEQGMLNNQAALNTYIQNMQNQGTAPSCNETIFPTLGICDSAVYWGVGIAAAALVLFVKLK